MKEYTKTKKVMVGVKGDLSDFLHTAQEYDIEFCDGEGRRIFTFGGDDVVTLKIDGKVIDPKDITIFIEGET